MNPRYKKLLVLVFVLSIHSCHSEVPIIHYFSGDSLQTQETIETDKLIFLTKETYAQMDMTLIIDSEELNTIMNERETDLRKRLFEMLKIVDVNNCGSSEICRDLHEAMKKVALASPRPTPIDTTIILSLEQTRYKPELNIIRINIIEKIISVNFNNFITEINDIFTLVGDKQITFESLFPEMDWTTIDILIEKISNHANNISSIHVTTTENMVSLTDGLNLKINLSHPISAEDLENMLIIHNQTYDLVTDTAGCNSGAIFFQIAISSDQISQEKVSTIINQFKILDDSETSKICTFLKEQIDGKRVLVHIFNQVTSYIPDVSMFSRVIGILPNVDSIVRPLRSRLTDHLFLDATEDSEINHDNLLEIIQELFTPD